MHFADSFNIAWGVADGTLCGSFSPPREDDISALPTGPNHPPSRLLGCHTILTAWKFIVSVDSRLAPSQWETSLQSNAVSHWLGANLESALILPRLRSCDMHVIGTLKCGMSVFALSALGELQMRNVMELNNGKLSVDFGMVAEICVLIKSFWPSKAWHRLDSNGKCVKCPWFTRDGWYSFYFDYDNVMTWNFSVLLAFCEENPPAIGGFSSHRASNVVLWSYFIFVVVVDLHNLTNSRLAGDIRQQHHVHVTSI